MISVIVQGRNDSHGYNLHKRVAISLNALASLLREPDELIFVDWNTPDELPTLPEAIADTLTEACRRFLRILRVRPDQHQRFNPLAHLPLLDPVARNVAIRRASASSQWMLSTTTDIVLLPQQGAVTLADVAGPLADGLYHAPRFDVPEALWESLDRLQPEAAMEACRDWGRTLHLNEIVEATPLVKFDGPGDFQLLPMASAKAMTGFDERMVFTYHMDSNLARRAGMVVGPVRSLESKILVYHLSHYRVASVHHSAARAENSWTRFVEDAQRIAPPSQAETWGLAEEEVEDFRLPPVGRSALAETLKSILPPPAAVTPGVTVTPATFDTLKYAPEHVLPFLMDLLTPLPRHAQIGMVAATPALALLTAKACAGLGFAKRLAVCGPLAPHPEHFDSFEEGALFEAAAALIFDFQVQDNIKPIGDDARGELGALSALFRKAVALERGRPDVGRAPPRFIVVNGIHTSFERLVLNNLVFTYTPYTSRIRHGVVRRQPALRGDLASLGAWISERTGRRLVPHQEVADAVDLIQQALDYEEAAPASLTVLALLDHPGLASALGADPEQLASLAEATRLKRASSQLATDLIVTLNQGARRPTDLTCCFASVLDWESPAWNASLAEGDEAAQTANFLRRERATWEIGQAIHAVAHHAGAAFHDRILMVAPDRLRLPEYLAHRARTVAVVAAGGSAADHADDVWPNPGAFCPPGSVERLDGQLGELSPEAGQFDIVIMPGHAAGCLGAVRLFEMIERADRMLREGGVIIFAVETTIGSSTAADRIPGALVVSGAVEDILVAHTGLQPAGPVDWTMDEATVDLLAKAGSDSEDRPHFVIKIGNVLSTTAMWTLRKARQTTTGGWLEAQRAWTSRFGESSLTGAAQSRLQP